MWTSISGENLALGTQKVRSEKESRKLQAVVVDMTFYICLESVLYAVLIDGLIQTGNDVG